MSVLSEAYSHDPFERRVKATYAFVAELLSYVGEQGRTLTARTRLNAVRATAARTTSARTPVPIRARMTTAPFIVPATQELRLLALILLEPQSDDGLTTWNGFDDQLAVGGRHPVRRALATIPYSR